MRTIHTLLFFLLFSWMLVRYTQAELKQSHLEMVKEQLPKIEQSIHLLEDELERAKEDLSIHYKKLEEIRSRLQQNPSILEVGKLKSQELYYEQIVNKNFNDVDDKTVQITIYHAILFAFGSKQVSREKVQGDVIFLAKVKARLKWAKAQHDIAQERWTKAQKRLIEIPQENICIQQTIEELQKKLDVLEYKKSWSNLTERLEIKAKITAEKGKILKNEGETFAQDKIKQDSWQEMQSMMMEQVEAEIAIDVLEKV